MTSVNNEIKVVESPIDLESVDESALMFYLAGESPLPLSEFSAQCKQSEQHVRTLLNDRFQNQLQVDQTGFLRLTEAARSSILVEANPLLTEATEVQKRGKALLDEDNYEGAVEQYQAAAKLYSVVHRRLSTVCDVPDKLIDRLDSTRTTHDKIQKELRKDTLVHRKLLAEQRAEEADEAAQAGEYQNAIASYERAIDAFVEARTAVEEYNECRLSSSSPVLDPTVIDDLIDNIKQKKTDVAEHVSKSTNEDTVQTETPDTSSTKQSSTEQTGQSGREINKSKETDDRETTDHSPSREAVLRQIDRHRDKLTENPKLKTLLAETSWNQNDVLTPFESWEEALEIAGIDKKQALIEDLRQTAAEIDGQPTGADQNAHGQFSAGMFYNVFDSWNEALAAADIDRPSRSHQDQTSSRHSGQTSSSPTDGGPKPSDFPAFDDLPPSKRFSDELAVHIEEELYAGAKRDGSLKTSDHTGETIRFDIWAKHDLDPPEAIDSWYVVEEVRLQQWESDGEQKRNLSSTRDMVYRRLDSNETEGSNKGREEDDEVSEVQSKEDESETQQNAETSTNAKDSSPTSTDETTAGADSGDGLLGSIEDEFDDDFI